MKTSFKTVLSNTGKAIERHSAELFLGVGIIGIGTSLVLAVKATPKAMELIEQKKEEEKVEKLTVVDTVKTTWKCYIPTAVTTVATVMCLVKSNSEHTKRTAALATAYEFSRTALEQYKNKVVEVVGEKKANEVREEVAKETAEKAVSQTNSNVIVMNNGGDDVSCVDSLSGQLFPSSIDKINKAVNEINYTLLNEGYTSLNTFYSLLGMETTRLGSELGWNIDYGKLEVSYTTQINDDKPCLVIEYNILPRYEYWKMGY
jgi:hypothetical protein